MRRGFAPVYRGWLGWSLLGLSAVLSVSALVVNLSPQYANLAATGESATHAALTMFEPILAQPGLWPSSTRRLEVADDLCDVRA